jgi:hypothetical protein
MSQSGLKKIGTLDGVRWCYRVLDIANLVRDTIVEKSGIKKGSCKATLIIYILRTFFS